MNREPDWETLSEMNFLLHRRMTEHLNEALVALDQLDKTNADPLWRARAAVRVTEALDLYTAWSNLVRYKSGESRAVRRTGYFAARPLLEWLSAEMQLPDLPNPGEELFLNGNRETLQEALLLLRSCATTLGPRVRVLVELQKYGLWFRIQYRAVKEPPASVEELLETLGGNWRSHSTAFELRSARDFLEMNDCELFYSIRENDCELAFFVRVKPGGASAIAAELPAQPQTLLDAVEARTETAVSSDRRTRPVRPKSAKLPPAPRRILPDDNTPNL